MPPHVGLLHDGDATVAALVEALLQLDPTPRLTLFAATEEDAAPLRAAFRDRVRVVPLFEHLGRAGLHASRAERNAQRANAAVLRIERSAAAALGAGQERIANTVEAMTHAGASGPARRLGFAIALGIVLPVLLLALWLAELLGALLIRFALPAARLPLQAAARLLDAARQASVSSAAAEAGCEVWLAHHPGARAGTALPHVVCVGLSPRRAPVEISVAARDIVFVAPERVRSNALETVLAGVPLERVRTFPLAGASPAAADVADLAVLERMELRARDFVVANAGPRPEPMGACLIAALLPPLRGIPVALVWLAAAPCSAEWRALLEAHGIGVARRWLPALPFHARAALCAAASAVVLADPQRDRRLALEAIAHQARIVCADVAPLRRLLGGAATHARFFEPGNSGSLAAALADAGRAAPVPPSDARSVAADLLQLIEQAHGSG